MKNFIGMRTLKTGIAVILTCILTGFAVDNMFYAATACVVTMQDTIKTSFKMGSQRVFGTLIGGLVGFLLFLVIPKNPFLCGIGIMIVIKLCEMFKLSSLVVSSVTFFSLYLGYINSAPLTYSLQRVFDTSIGVIIGVSVNYFIFRPNYLKSIYKELRIIEKTSIELLKGEIEKGKHEDRSHLKSEITKLEQFYKNFLE